MLRFILLVFFTLASSFSGWIWHAIVHAAHWGDLHHNAASHSHEGAAPPQAADHPILNIDLPTVLVSAQDWPITNFRSYSFLALQPRAEPTQPVLLNWASFCGPPFSLAVSLLPSSCPNRAPPCPA
jgi:hypothetical protein